MTIDSRTTGRTPTKLNDIHRLLDLYVRLPDTPSFVSPSDHQLVARLLGQGVPLSAAEGALLLGSARRIRRDPDAPPLAPIRSLAYFLPVIEELGSGDVLKDGYREYLERIVPLAEPD